MKPRIPSPVPVPTGVRSRTPDRRAVLELVLVLATGGLHVVFETGLDAKAFYLPAAGLVWIVYIFRGLRRDPGWLRVWGFRRDNLRAAMGPALVVAVLGSGLLLGLGRTRGAITGTAHIWLTLVAYPVWALAQQFLLNAMLARNLRRYLGTVATVLIAALFFALAHAPDLPVMSLSFIGGLVWTSLYLARPNLWVLSGLHGLLGTLAYHMVLGRDPWAPFFR